MDDTHYMARALELAKQARGRTSPNPMVGCIIVRDGQILGEGYHQRAGAPHAEVNAIEAAGPENVPGATLYVTLEPCTHFGKTPPCVDLLLQLRPARVVVAMQDPNPQVAGTGIQKLRDAGIAVEVGVLEAEAQRLNEVFAHFITTGRPFVTGKWAMTADGKIATHTGHSQWVTGEAARARVHEMRDTVDAILVGSRTVMVDNPRLTTRLEGRVGKDPIRIVLDGEDYLSCDHNIFTQASAAPTWVAVSKPDREYDCADDVLYVPQGPSGIDPAALMDELGRRGITSLLIEGGGTTLATFFEADLVDKVCFFIAPSIVGGRDALTPVEGTGIDTMDAARRLHDLQVEPVGQDLMITGYVGRAGVLTGPSR
jgi:diaminohydroxyphosphoribosylaminopyrimidine deaminase/5-amino-6-(5-phosphoribosylamino)uracil reductase